MSNFIADQITVTPVQASNPDAALVEMLGRWQRFSDLHAELSDRVDELWAAALNSIPMPPQVRPFLQRRAGDRDRFDLVNRRMELGNLIAKVIAPADLDQHRDTIEEFSREATEIDAQLRMLDEYEAAVVAERVLNGHAALDEQCRKSESDMMAVEREIAAFPAVSLLGVQVKLALFDRFSGFGDTEPSDDGAPDNRLFSAALRDLQRLSGYSLGQLFGE